MPKFAITTLSFLFLMALIGPFLSAYNYSDIQLDLKNTSPGLQFWFGSDELGRDLFTRIWWGARISLFVGITAAGIDLVLGVIYGSIAGLWGGKLDETMMRFTDIIYSIPYLLIVILLTVVMGSGLMTIIIALTLTGWIPMARIVRGQVLQLKEL